MKGLWLSIDILLTVTIVSIVLWFLSELVAIVGRIGAFLATLS